MTPFDVWSRIVRALVGLVTMFAIHISLTNYCAPDVLPQASSTTTVVKPFGFFTFTACT